MFRNYLKIAIRNILKQKGLAAINILGLSIGLACFSLFLLYSVNEFSFDRFHEKSDQIYRVYRWTEAMFDSDASGDTYLPMPLGPAIEADFPDVEKAVRYRDDWGPEFVRIDGEVRRKGIAFADPAFFDLFDFEIQYGNANSPLLSPNDIVLTAETALQFFGEPNPVGRSIEIRLDGEFIPFTVSAVVANMPPNSTLQFDMLGNFDFYENSTRHGKSSKDNWRRSAFQTFVLLREGSGLPSDDKRLLAFREKFYPDTESRLREEGHWTGEGAPVTYGLQPLRNMHTDSRIGGETVDPKNIWILLAIAAGLLLIACINFTTLAIGRSAGRAREVGVRKVIGSHRSQLIGQFLSEAVVLALLSAFIGIALGQLLLPYFNELSGRELAFSLEKYPELAWMIAGITLLAGLMAGSYPALVLSGFRPVDVLKSKIKLGGANLFTKSLVTLQFVVSIGLVASTLIILQQLNYMRGKNPGFNKENVVVVDASGTETNKIYPLFRQKLESRPEVRGIAGSELGIGAGMGWSRSGFDYKGERKEVFEYFVDHYFVDVMKLQVLKGRNFDPAIASDTINSVIINETMMKDFGWTYENAVGQQLTGYFDDGERAEPVVIGIVKDFNYRPLSEEVRPQMFHQYADYAPYRFFVRLRPDEPGDALAVMETAWNELVPGFPFTYSFLDEDIDRFYHAEERFSNIVAWAGGISIFLACLGLFGLAALAAANRRKEIGIRKVLGASIAGITGMLTTDFLKLVGIAIVIASPIAWYFMHDWLNTFAYRIDFPWWYFGIAGIIAVVVAFVTVGFQSIIAAMSDPVKSLRSE